MNHPTTTISQARQYLATLDGVPLTGPAAQLRSHLAAVLAELELEPAQRQLLAGVFTDAVRYREAGWMACPDCDQADRRQDGPWAACERHRPGIERAVAYDALAERLWPLGLLPGPSGQVGNAPNA